MFNSNVGTNFHSKYPFLIPQMSRKYFARFVRENVHYLFFRHIFKVSQTRKHLKFVIAGQVGAGKVYELA